jgi:hypothetical protein
MSFWLYHQQMPLCRVRRLVDDRAESGTVVLALPANLANDLSMLTDELELYEDQNDHLEAIQALAVQSTGDEVELTIMAMGGWRDADEQRFNDDWLLVDGKATCPVESCLVSPDACPNGLHVRFTVAGDALRRVNYRRRRLQALRQVQQTNVHGLGGDAVGLMVPLTYDGPKTESETLPQIEILRLRSRLRIPISMDLADAGMSSVTIVGHAGSPCAIGRRQPDRTKTPITSSPHHRDVEPNEVSSAEISTQPRG